MDTLKVIVENWPETNILLEYMPLFIALIALAVSLYSVYLTRKAFIASQRPYVWGGNYGVIDPDNKTIIPVPSKVGVRVKNAPAKIIMLEVKIYLGEEQLFEHADRNMVRFPDDRSERGFAIGHDEFKRIMERKDDDRYKLSRKISIEYTSLDGGKIYHYKLGQSFNTADNQWKDTSEEAD